MNIKRLQQTLNEFNQYGADEKGINRLSYSQAHWGLTQYFIRLCRHEGLEVRVDECGNVIARRAGARDDLPAVACGSHLDTVYHGGRFDGTLGVVAGLEVIRSLNEAQIKTKYPIELIAFACEESSRFGVSTVGSKAMIGKLNVDKIGNLRDRDGVTFREALAVYSLELEQFDEVVRRPEEFRIFLELHIEQGPILEREKKAIGIVTGIAAPTRYRFEIIGKASHSGTTPMQGRQDALLGAAEISLILEKAAITEERYGTVATVGVCSVQPGAMNVIPDHVELSLEVRGVSLQSKARVVGTLFNELERIKKRRGLTITSTLLSDEVPVLLSADIVESLAQRCEESGISYRTMSSGAGHDAMNMAQLCPTGVIFVPSRDGLSHHPDEYTSIEAIANGAEVLYRELLHWAEQM